MEKRWIGVVVMSLAVVAACTQGAQRMLGSDPPGDDAVGGSASELFAGTGGESGTGGGNLGGSGVSADGMPSEVCDSAKPTSSPEDASAPFADAGPIGDGVASNDDAGVDSNPEPNTPEPTPDGGPGMATAPTLPRQHGAVIVTELMFDPTLVADAVGEWIELHNTTSTDLELGGCVVSDDRSDDFVVAPLVVPVDGYVVLGRTAEAAPLVDQIYSGMVLANTADEVVITCDGVLIDRVAYGTGFPRHAGKTMQLDSARLDAVNNDGGASWCDGVDSGTPGAANLPCVTE